VIEKTNKKIMNKKFFYISILVLMSLFNFAQTSINEFSTEMAYVNNTTEITDEMFSENIQIERITGNVVLRLVDKMESTEDEHYLKAVFNGLDAIKAETTAEFKTDCDENLTEEVVIELCATIRTQQDAIRRPRFGYAENILLELAGIDPDNTTSAEIRQKMEAFFISNYKCLECTDVVSPFPRGNYLKQLASGNYLRQFQTFLRGYRFPVNIIDESDGCTVLDYVDAKISDTPESSTNIHEYLQKVRALLIREGAKHANDLGGEC